MRIGISGHQDLGSSQTRAWVRQQMLDFLRKMDCSSGISSLAAGADQLFAEAIVELKRDLEVVIPCRRYEETFDKAQLVDAFHRLKQKASKCYVLEFEAPSEEAFYRAGCTIVDMSDLMLFVWNGQSSRGFGGTADIVSYAQRQGRAHVRIDSSEAPQITNQ